MVGVVGEAEDFSEGSSGIFPEFFRNFLRFFCDFFEILLGFFCDSFGIFLGSFRNIFGTFLRPFRDIFVTFSGHFWAIFEIFWGHDGIFWDFWDLLGFLRILWGYFLDISTPSHHILHDTRPSNNNTSLT